MKLFKNSKKRLRKQSPKLKDQKHSAKLTKLKSNPHKTNLMKVKWNLDKIPNLYYSNKMKSKTLRSFKWKYSSQAFNYFSTIWVRLLQINPIELQGQQKNI